MRRLALVLVPIWLLGGCADSMSTYSRQDVGRMMEMTPGTVVSARPVTIKGERSGLGAVSGGAAGAAIGYSTIGSGSGSTAAGIVGGLLGAVLGSLAEEALTSRSGIEYTVQTDDGRMVTIVQNRAGDEKPIAPGTDVMIQWGGEYSRVIPQRPGTPPATAPGPYAGVPGKKPASEPSGAVPPPPAGTAPPAATPPSRSDWVNPDAPSGTTGGSTGKRQPTRQPPPSSPAAPAPSY